MNTQADNSQFSIQVVASESPDLANFKELLEFGSPYIENTDNSLVRVKVGSFSSRVNAEKALEKIRNKGFKDAFISSYTGKAVTFAEKKIIPTTIIKKASYGNKLADPETTKGWAKLSEGQKKNVVYLDGILHLHVDGDFIPLSNY